MNYPGSIFLEFSLPNSTTWFYFSFLLVMALFFKFTRLLSIRNWDLVTIFLLVPGLLLLQQGRQQSRQGEEAATIASALGQAGAVSVTTGQTGTVGAAAFTPTEVKPERTGRFIWIGYLWLLMCSLYLVFRCLLDLVLVRRPALSANLNSSGMGWLAVALFVCLTTVAFRPPERSSFSSLMHTTPQVQQTEEPVGRPSAAVSVVENSFDASFLLMRSFAIVCHFSVIAGLVVVGRLHFHDCSAGMAAATLYLLLPYTGYYVGQVHHVLPMALMIWALVFYRRPAVAGIFMGLAAGTVFFPALIVPVWIGFYWRRGAGRFTSMVAFSAAICLGVTGFVLWRNNELARVLTETFALSDWQPWNWQAPAEEGFWTNVHWAYRTPIFILYAVLVILAAFWPHPKNLAHVIALSAVILIGIQLWYANQGGVYVLWYLPFVLLMIFRPNLSLRRPPIIKPETDWLNHANRAFARFLGWLFKSPKPVAKVH